MNVSGFSFGVGLFALLTGTGILFTSDYAWIAFWIWGFFSLLGIINIVLAFNNLEVKMVKKK